MMVLIVYERNLVKVLKNQIETWVGAAVLQLRVVSK